MITVVKDRPIGFGDYLTVIAEDLSENWVVEYNYELDRIAIMRKIGLPYFEIDPAFPGSTVVWTTCRPRLDELDQVEKVCRLKVIFRHGDESHRCDRPQRIEFGYELYSFWPGGGWNEVLLLVKDDGEIEGYVYYDRITYYELCTKRVFGKK